MRSGRTDNEHRQRYTLRSITVDNMARISALLFVVLDNVYLDSNDREQIYDKILSNIKEDKLPDIVAQLSDLMSRP